MLTKHVEGTLSQTEAQDLLTRVNALEDALPFLIDLNLDERKAMVKFGDKSQAFVNNAADLVRQHPEILPPAFDLAAFEQEVDLLAALLPIRHALENLLGRLQDTTYALGSDTYTASLHIYTYAKTANLMTGALEDAMDDLGKRFARRAPVKAAAKAD